MYTESGSVSSVPNQRGANQVQRSYWIDRNDLAAAEQAAQELNTKLPIVIRAAFTQLVQEAEQKRKPTSD